MGVKEEGEDEEQRKRCSSGFQIHCTQAQGPFLILFLRTYCIGYHHISSLLINDNGKTKRVFDLVLFAAWCFICEGGLEGNAKKTDEHPGSPPSGRCDAQNAYK